MCVCEGGQFRRCGDWVVVLGGAMYTSTNKVPQIVVHPPSTHDFFYIQHHIALHTRFNHHEFMRMPNRASNISRWWLWWSSFGLCLHFRSDTPQEHLNYDPKRAMYQC